MSRRDASAVPRLSPERGATIGDGCAPKPACVSGPSRSLASPSPNRREVSAHRRYASLAASTEVAASTSTLASDLAPASLTGELDAPASLGLFAVDEDAPAASPGPSTAAGASARRTQEPLAQVSPFAQSLYRMHEPSG